MDSGSSVKLSCILTFFAVPTHFQALQIPVPPETSLRQLSKAGAPQQPGVLAQQRKKRFAIAPVFIRDARQSKPPGVGVSKGHEEEVVIESLCSDSDGNESSARCTGLVGPVTTTCAL